MNSWNQLADLFGCRWDDAEIPACAADNVCIAWPAILTALDQGLPDKAPLTVLDYGCGGGLFCRQLHALGHRVSGYEPAAELLRAARENVPPEVVLTSDPAALAAHAPFDAIVTIMVLPFIADLYGVVASLAEWLRPDGVVVTAVFDAAFVRDNAGEGRLFPEYSAEAGVGLIELKAGVRLPVFIRGGETYQEAFARHGLREIARARPPFTPEFLAAYPQSFATRQPEYLIQVFRRHAN
ncbi:MAG: class I SAM-dependent methyltransferase [Thermodesulfobacteriota bacterium]